jgi:O-acetyl-ADP-ribose deacetylase (regulator of RNase III)
MFEEAYTWRIGNLRLHIATGDLFEAPVEAIVNSEQTDFRLAWNLGTVTGQVRRRWGELVSSQLERQTQGETQPLSTVLTTDGPPYKAIFHAGFHHPDVWLSGEADDNGAEHIRVIGECVFTVLRMMKDANVQSVGFPLIGCGLFGLDPGLMAFEFFERVFSSGLAAAKEQHDIWLVVLDQQLVRPVVEAGVQQLLHHLPQSGGSEPLRLGVPFLDEFSEQVALTTHPHWRAWLMARHAELIATYICARLARGVRPPHQPPELLEPDRPPSFGVIREGAAKFAKEIHATGIADAWSRFLAQIVIDDLTAGRLQRINTDRNDIAHGRKFRAAEEIDKELRTFCSLPQWTALAANESLADVDQLVPWMRRGLPIDGNKSTRTGVLDKWNEKKWTYLVPASGERFTVPAADS